MESSAQPISLMSAGNPLDEATKVYNNNFSYILIKFAVLTIVHILVLVWALIGTGLSDLVNNWPKYRCNPLIMPFAGLFGYDAGENFNYCMKNIFSLNAGVVLAPVYGVMSSFTDIVSTISNVANSFRYLIANLLHGMERLMNSFRDRFQFILFSIRMSFFKIMTLMGRLYATFYSVIFMGLSAMQGINNVANNDLIKFMMEFCFSGSTVIELLDGSKKQISHLTIGDRLKMVNGVSPSVTSLFRFNGQKTSMVRINDIKVSCQHYVLLNGSWIESDKHPDAIISESEPEIYCLNTDTHTVSIGGLIFSDYDESSDLAVMDKTKRLSESLLNNGVISTNSGLEGVDYDLGLCPEALIYMKNGTIVPISKIAIGDKLIDDGTVLGVVSEQVSTVVKIGDLQVSASQMIWDAISNKWIRAGALYPSLINVLETPVIFNQLIVSNNILRANGLFFRDYREVSDLDMETEYAQKLSQGV